VEVEVEVEVRAWTRVALSNQGRDKVQARVEGQAVLV
jgi:hypothetical protein